MASGIDHDDPRSENPIKEFHICPSLEATLIEMLRIQKEKIASSKSPIMVLGSNSIFTLCGAQE